MRLCGFFHSREKVKEGQKSYGLVDGFRIMLTYKSQVVVFYPTDAKGKKYDR